jgi:hypothetical protein
MISANGKQMERRAALTCANTEVLIQGLSAARMLASLLSLLCEERSVYKRLHATDSDCILLSTGMRWFAVRRCLHV